ncbi:MAG: peptidoglycan editing factor PgeF [Geminicoccaceae bacterium]|nr:peptidoglycan editing factor PgeF [Geminicoccaceae bacterium]
MIFDEAAPLKAVGHVRHGFFGRRGGVGEGPFGTLNVSLRNADRREAAVENRTRVAAALGERVQALSIARQVHGTGCVALEEPLGLDGTVEADALVTDRPGIALGVTTADCGPILFADLDHHVIGAAHAGWRGALAGITASTLDAMERLGADRRRIVAVIGPCIAVESYEVGPEMERAFIDAGPVHSRHFRDVAGRRHFDLRGYLAARLKREHVAHIGHVARDTYAERDMFFSFRRTTHEGGGPFGLQVSAIALST